MFFASPVFAFPTLVPEECLGGAQVHDNPNTQEKECAVCEANQEDRSKCCCDLSSFERLAFNVAQIILGISGSLALIMFVIGGILYITSGGQDAKIKKATDVLKYAVIGLAIILLSGVLVKFFLAKLMGIQ